MEQKNIKARREGAMATLKYLHRTAGLAVCSERTDSRRPWMGPVWVPIDGAEHERLVRETIADDGEEARDDEKYTRGT